MATMQLLMIFDNLQVIKVTVLDGPRPTPV